MRKKGLLGKMSFGRGTKGFSDMFNLIVYLKQVHTLT